jgi:hypothetical protein
LNPTDGTNRTCASFTVLSPAYRWNNETGRPAMDVISAFGLGIAAVFAGPLISSSFGSLRRSEILRKLRR